MIHWTVEGTDSEKGMLISSWLAVIDCGAQYHLRPPWEDLKKHLCAHAYTLPLLANQSNARDAFEAAVRNPEGNSCQWVCSLQEGTTLFRAYLPFILSHFKMWCGDKKSFCSSCKMTLWWVFFHYTCQLFFICFLKKGYVLTALGYGAYKHSLL